MIIGLLFAVCAGVFVGVQGIFNRHVNMHVSSWAATAFILATGSLAALIMGLVIDGTAIFDVSGMKPAYWLFGLVGIGVIFCTMTAMKKIGPTKTIVIGVIAQLTASMFFDMTGFLALPKMDIGWNHIAGLLLMIVGITIFNMKKKTA
ncbi:DMT family transporter [Caryophanon tenue]|uniref:EamA-like transporter family protein n=1 Tax=Caryophanon tenue TaxID=33978 RepID=A0A1C0Y6Z5_9BACL|nr:DMT family transporter [Caryophanon tenue]OCS82921.1 hypothetical protein A6M13_05840 [Caryophanon tenue]